MKKVLTLSLLFLSVSAFSFSQEVGYKTTDIGAEYGHYTGGNVFNLHVAFNSKLHHSFIIRAGYNAVSEQQSTFLKNESGGGITAGLGYRYFFSYRPHRFFLGVRADYRKFDVDWYDVNSSGNYKLNNYFIGGEAGYKLLINDQIFITPTIGLGVITGIDGGPVRTGFSALPGISAGVQF
jgi:hypothetical protein